MTRGVLCPKCGEPLRYRERAVERRDDGLYQHALCAPDFVVQHPVNHSGCCGCVVPAGVLVGFVFLLLVFLGVLR